VWHRTGAVGIGEAQRGTIVIELNPLGRAREPVAAGNVEVGDAPIVDRVPFRGSFEGFLVLEDLFLKPLNLLSEPSVLHGGVGFVVGDGCKKSIHNRAKEFHVNVRIGGKGRLRGVWGHCR